MPRTYTFKVKGRSRMLIKAIKICGGSSRLAAKLNVKRQAVTNWNAIPKGRIKQIRAIINGR